MSDPKVFDAQQPDWVDYAYVIPGGPDRLSPPPGSLCRERRSWATELNGADAWVTQVEVALQGNVEGQVLIDDVKVEVLKRERPIRGILANCPTGGADVVPLGVMVDLDTNPPSVGYTDKYEDSYDPKKWKKLPHPIALTKGEHAVFRVNVSTKKCYCEWKIVLSLVERGKRQQVTIDDGGRPFRTDAATNAITYAWDGRKWTRQ